MSTLRRRTGSIWTRSFKRNLSRIQLVAFVIEFILAIAAVIIHSIAYPESFRKTLWEIGGEAGWNSNPKLRIYFYANYRQPPEIPLLWTQRLSETNLSVALIATSVFFARLVLVFFDYAGSLCSILYDILLSALWLYSILAQSSGDLSDTEHLSLRPWYLEKGCYRVAPPYIHVCYIARSAFGISIVSL
ncbi:hypothetical protein F5Y10DRAFT_257359 [Nemania abortiva]|nr:hypothetical protein F5Y10DRAFT_257359 [Nemania abortiva]